MPLPLPSHLLVLHSSCNQAEEFCIIPSGGMQDSFWEMLMSLLQVYFLCIFMQGEPQRTDPQIPLKKILGTDECGTYEFVFRNGVNCRHNTKPPVREEPAGHHMHEYWREASSVCGMGTDRNGEKSAYHINLGVKFTRELSFFSTF